MVEFSKIGVACANGMSWPNRLKTLAANSPGENRVVRKSFDARCASRDASESILTVRFSQIRFARFRLLG
jgi:hypothetical protein